MYHSLSKARSLINLVLLFALLNPILSNGQALSLDELLSIKKSDFVTINDKLISKGWNYSDSYKGQKSGELEEFSSVVWAYEMTDAKKATGWLSFFVAQNNSFVVYEFYSATIYDVIRKQITANGLKQIKNSIEQSKIQIVYQGSQFTIQISIESLSDKGFPRYLISVYSNNVYKVVELEELLNAVGRSPLNQQRESIKSVVDQGYDGSYLYKSKAYSLAPIYKDFAGRIQLYKVPPDHFVYVLSEMVDNKIRVYCDGNFGYMDKSFLNR